MTSISRYEAAVQAAEGAYLAVGGWVDEVRQAAEARMGVGPADRDVLDDPDYARAVAAMGPAFDLKRILGDLRGLAEHAGPAPRNIETTEE